MNLEIFSRSNTIHGCFLRRKACIPIVCARGCSPYQGCVGTLYSLKVCLSLHVLHLHLELIKIPADASLQSTWCGGLIHDFSLELQPRRRLQHLQ